MVPKAEYLAANRDKAVAIIINASKDQTAVDEATWVECSVNSCRAQYIVYDVPALGVRPKYHYCRQNSGPSSEWHGPVKPPTVECSQCLNRMIWPKEYRPAKFSESNFQVPSLHSRPQDDRRC